jgi:hypothetical protein
MRLLNNCAYSFVSRDLGFDALTHCEQFPPRAIHPSGSILETIPKPMNILPEQAAHLFAPLQLGDIESPCASHQRRTFS